MRAADSVRRQLENHMRDSCANAHTIAYDIQPIERVNLQMALDRWLESEPLAHLLGYSTQYLYSSVGLAHLAIHHESVAPVQRERFPFEIAGDVDCVIRGIYLLRYEKQPIAIMIRRSDGGLDQRHILELMAHKRQVAQAALSALLSEARSQNVYKGKSISLEKEREWGPEFFIRYHEIPPTPRESIVLPDSVMKVIEGNVLGLVKHGDALRRAGRSTRYGALFHGRPGTGKTIAARYLASTCSDHTIILLTGRQMGLIRESCATARLLAPSIVILEDVDLIAEERANNRCPTVLHELMDEMDGIGGQTDCVFLLTTNRPEILEPALAARPGRIDQAIEFPLPDEECRRRLFDLYGQGLDLTWLDLDRWIEQTDGVSPAFIKELLRKSALIAAERGETAEPMRLQNRDIDLALKELIHFGGELTRRLLGYKT
jgi:SpoVK/Ycf46/Vps4 family AAA+-type ATPase